MNLLEKQYELVQSSREVVLKYCESMKQDDPLKEIETFNKNSIIQMLMHVANTYVFWFGNFEQGREFPYFKDEEVKNISELRNVFGGVDKLVHEFLERFRDNYSVHIEGYIFWLKKNRTETPLSLFTHVTTHEFHHKGQIMTMSRLLGYTPPDADVIRF
jgi:uncharacterized damage-inducible protein DinB